MFKVKYYRFIIINFLKKNYSKFIKKPDKKESVELCYKLIKKIINNEDIENNIKNILKKINI